MSLIVYYSRLMALPLLPAEHIPGAFEALVDNLAPTVDARVSDVISYVTTTWLDSRLWPPHSWSAYKSSVRTNNDVEGWHNRLNHRSRRGQLDLYQLAPVLHQEAQYVSIQSSLVSESKLRRHQHKTYAAIQGRLSEYWALYAAGDMTTSALLRKCSRIYGPVTV